MDNKTQKITKKRGQYTQEQLKAALEAVKHGESLRKVAQWSLIPYSTLHKKLTTRSDGKIVFCLPPVSNLPNQFIFFCGL